MSVFQARKQDSEGQEAHASSLHGLLGHGSSQNHVTWPSIAARESGEVIVFFYWKYGYPELSWGAVNKGMEWGAPNGVCLCGYELCL